MSARIILLLLVCLCLQQAQAQQTRIYTDPLESYHKAKDLYQKEQYSLAYPMFRELSANLREPDYSNYRISFEEVDYYTISCALRQNEGTAEE